MQRQLDDVMGEFRPDVDLDPKSPIGYIRKKLVLGQVGDFKSVFGHIKKQRSTRKGD